MENATNLVFAQATLKAASGKSYLADSANVTSDNIESYKPSSKTVQRATKLLEKAGFKVTPTPFSLTVAGPTELFERYFDTKLTKTADSSYQFDKAIALPKKLAELVDGISISEPPIYFDHIKRQ